MSRLLQVLLRHGGTVLALVSVLMLLALLHLLLLLAPLKPSVLALQSAWTAAQFWHVLGSWGADGMQLYRSHFRHDHLAALLYGAWGALMVARSGLFDGLTSRSRWCLAALLPAAAVLDLLENAAHLYVLAGPPGGGAQVVPWAALCSLLKCLLMVLFLAVLLWRCTRAWGPSLAGLLELRVPPLALTLVAGMLMGGLKALLPAWQYPLPWPIAAVAVVLGAWLALAGVGAFRREHTTVNPVRPETARSLVSSGVYGVSRNPMYLGLALVLAGWAAWLGHPLAAVVVPLHMAYLHRFQILPEERALAAQFGPAFRLYCERVRRWL